MVRSVRPDTSRTEGSWPVQLCASAQVQIYSGSRATFLYVLEPLHPLATQMWLIVQSVKVPGFRPARDGPEN